MATLLDTQLLEMFATQVFVRPDSVTKIFDGQVMSIEDAAQLPRQYPRYHDSLVALSEVVGLGTEYRCFVHQGRVIAHSSYLTATYHPAPSAMITTAETIATAAAKRLTSSLLTVDLAEHRGVHRLVEIGGVNSWGLDGANQQARMNAMEDHALTQWAEFTANT